MYGESTFVEYGYANQATFAVAPAPRARPEPHDIQLSSLVHSALLSLLIRHLANNGVDEVKRIHAEGANVDARNTDGPSFIRSRWAISQATLQLGDLALASR